MNPFSDNIPLTPWQQRVYTQALSTLYAGRLGHGLLLCGPNGIGKRKVALQLAVQVLNQGQNEHAQARNQQLLQAGTHPDLQLISLLPNKSGDKLRSEIVIEQVRELTHRLTLTPQYGAAQVVIMDPADAINHAACNALLKTLEEPADGRYLWLLSAEPARLPQTIRSRCQRLVFRLPPYEEALAWLQQNGHDLLSSKEALAAARGHPALAQQWLEGEGMALRRQVAAELQHLAATQMGSVELAQRWAADDHADLRLHHAADWALEQAHTCLTEPAYLHTLARWFDAVNHTRDLLRGPLRADLAIAELLQAWAIAHRLAAR